MKKNFIYKKLRPNSIRKIEKFAFYVCDNLESVSIPDGFTFIGDYSFSDFYSLKNITIPETVTGIGTSAFYGCTNLVNIFYNGCEHTWSNIVINKNNTSLTNSEIHYTVPFLTRFFRAWADDIRIPATDPPVQDGTGECLAVPEEEERNDSD